MTDNRRIRIGDVPRLPNVEIKPYDGRRWGKAIDTGLSIIVLLMFFCAVIVALAGMGVP